MYMRTYNTAHNCMHASFRRPKLPHVSRTHPSVQHKLLYSWYVSCKV